MNKMELISYWRDHLNVVFGLDDILINEEGNYLETTREYLERHGKCIEEPSEYPYCYIMLFHASLREQNANVDIYARFPLSDTEKPFATIYEY